MRIAWARLFGQGDDLPCDETLDQGTDPENSGILVGYAESNNDDSDSPTEQENQALGAYLHRVQPKRISMV